MTNLNVNVVNSEELYTEREKLLMDLDFLMHPIFNIHVGYGARNRNNTSRLNISDNKDFIEKLREFTTNYINERLTEL